MKKLLFIILALLVGTTAFAASTDIAKPVALFETTLTERITASSTSMTLTSALTKDGSNLASSTYGFVIDEGTANEEFVLADCTATACTNLTRGISTLTGTTSVYALIKEHRRGASVKMTDAPLLLQLYNIVNGLQSLVNLVLSGNITVGGNASITGNLTVTGNETVAGLTSTNSTSTNATTTAMYISSILNAVSATITSLTANSLTVNTSASLPATTFTGTPTWNTNPTNASDLANKGYVDGVAIAGAASSTETQTGIVRLATKAQAALGTSAINGNRYVLPASMATSTSQVATTSVIVSNTSGKLDPSWLSGTEEYTFNATTTFNGKAYVGNTTIFTSSGTWNKPQGLRMYCVVAIGSGAGGISGNGNPGGGGGGAGGFSAGCFSGGTATSSMNIIVGAGGTAGNSGATTSLSSIISAPGGNIGSGATGGLGGVYISALHKGDVGLSGGNGGNGGTYSTGPGAGGGGGATGGGNGNDGQSGPSSCSANGGTGSTPTNTNDNNFGTGGKGGDVDLDNGTAGSVYGAGGGGGSYTASDTHCPLTGPWVGKSGANGLLIITSYF